MKSYIVEIFTAEANKVYFVNADTRAAAIKIAKNANGQKNIKPALGRDIPDGRCDRLLTAGKLDMVDLRIKA